MVWWTQWHPMPTRSRWLFVPWYCRQEIRSEVEKYHCWTGVPAETPKRCPCHVKPSAHEPEARALDTIISRKKNTNEKSAHIRGDYINMPHHERVSLMKTENRILTPYGKTTAQLSSHTVCQSSPMAGRLCAGLLCHSSTMYVPRLVLQDLSEKLVWRLEFEPESLSTLRSDQKVVSKRKRDAWHNSFGQKDFAKANQGTRLSQVWVGLWKSCLSMDLVELRCRDAGGNS